MYVTPINTKMLLLRSYRDKLVCQISLNSRYVKEFYGGLISYLNREALILLEKCVARELYVSILNTEFSNRQCLSPNSKRRFLVQDHLHSISRKLSIHKWKDNQVIHELYNRLYKTHVFTLFNLFLLTFLVFRCLSVIRHRSTTCNELNLPSTYISQICELFHHINRCMTKRKQLTKHGNYDECCFCWFAIQSSSLYCCRWFCNFKIYLQAK